MRLIEFEVRNYRNITRPSKINIGQYTVIVGKNNEGKSNLLRAIECAMNLLLEPKETDTNRGRRRMSSMSKFFNARRDFPVSGHTGRDRESYFILKFELNDTDREDFRRQINSTINSDLSIKITCNSIGAIEKKYLKRGRCAQSLAEKSDKIINFISKKIKSQYIGAVRTSEQSTNIVNDMIDYALLPLQNTQEYRDIINRISEMQRPYLDNLSTDIKNVLIKFIPDINEVKIISPFSQRLRSMGCKIQIDDGKLTPVEQKGDGIQSLVSLCLLRNQHEFSGISLVALEEPEAHLHQGAIHHLKEVISEIARENQVILSTHNPAFIDRSNFQNCVIVEGGNVRNANNIAEIRTLLGIHISDSLIATEIVVICEGEDDCIMLEAFCKTQSETIERGLNGGRLPFVSANGASKILINSHFYQNILCSVVAILDDDTEGNSAYNKIQQSGSVDFRNVSILKCEGMRESEFEDCIKHSSYLNIIKDKYGVDLYGQHARHFRNCRKKWSDRVADVFDCYGKTLDKQVESNIKYEIANSVSMRNSNDLMPEKCPALNNIVTRIEEMLHGQ